MSSDNGKTRVGLAIQGGVVPAGAFAAGVLNGLIDKKAFEQYDICAFSGTSAGAIIATLCWGHMLEGKIDTLGDDLVKQWTYLQWPQHLAVFPVWNPETGSMLTELDAFAMKFAFWRTFVQWFRTPFLRRTLINWINECINIDNLNDLFKARYSSPARTKRLGLALGSGDGDARQN